MQRDHELRKILGEGWIARTRPGGAIAATNCLVIAGLVVISISAWFLWIGFVIEFVTGFIEARMFVWIGLGILGFGAVCFVVAWGAFRGFRWGWFGAELLTVLSIALAIAVAWWAHQDGPTWLSFLAAVLVVDQFAIQCTLWRSSVRGWFLKSHRLRAQGYEGMGVELKGA